MLLGELPLATLAAAPGAAPVLAEAPDGAG
jgi:hypothetical protein